MRKQVRNSKTDLKITIENVDAKNGTVKDHNLCMVAQSIKREFGTEANVSRSRVLVKDLGTENEWTRFITPNDLRDEIIAFDRKGIITPGVYVLKATPKSMDKKIKTGKKTGTRPGRTRRKPIYVRNSRDVPGPSIIIS